eukprot:CAMPEP_0172505310 /NCGR_PEP_ID=MMETSP1066-20121228/185389_1 /TAXON_ID=671091 /ORGANISM="Coscinodiscus wailesii, Strain CCMP2513" /LENGTH=38 /DNA_ID= /DNA_START= /DNA_END= /DNA_ORIENTATION=
MGVDVCVQTDDAPCKQPVEDEETAWELRDEIIYQLMTR